MGLVKCKKCKKKISEVAKTCPNCGCKIKKENRLEIYRIINDKSNRKLLYAGLSVFIIFLTALVVSLISNLGTNTLEEEYYYKEEDVSYYIKIKDDNLCEYNDSLRGNLNCSYEVTRYEEEYPIEFKLILSLKDDSEVYTYYNCTRSTLNSNSIKGTYRNLYCENEKIEYDNYLVLSTKGSKE